MPHLSRDHNCTKTALLLAVIASIAILVDSLPSLPLTSCPTEGCSAGKSFVSVVRHSSLVTNPNASVAWTDPGPSPIGPPGSRSFTSCSSGSDGIAVCSARGYLLGYNASGRIWSSTITSLAGTALVGSGDAAQALARDQASLALAEIGSGSVDLVFNITPPRAIPRFRGIGPTLLPTITGANDVLLVNTGGLVEAWNTDASLCWASLFLCPPEGDTSSQCERDPYSTGFFLPAHSPVIVNGTVFFLCSLYGRGRTESREGAYLVAVKTGDISRRVYVDWVVELSTGDDEGSLPCSHENVQSGILSPREGSGLVFVCLNSTKGGAAIVAVSTARRSKAWRKAPRGRQQPGAFAMFADPDPSAQSLWLWEGSGSLVSVAEETGEEQSALTIPRRYGDLCTRMTAVVGSPDVSSGRIVVAAFSLREPRETSATHAEIVALSLPPSSGTPRGSSEATVLWSVPCPYTPVGQIVTLDSSMGPAHQPTLVLATEGGIIGVQ